MVGMKPPIVVRIPTDEERQILKAGLRSPNALVLRRCQILLASTQNKPVKEIAADLKCAAQSVRNVLHAFNRGGVEAALVRQSNRPKSARPILDEAGRTKLKALLEQSPRTWGKQRSTWTLGLVAQVAHEQGLSGERQLSIESVRTALKRLGMNWKRAKAWINSPGTPACPDGAYTRKKSDVTG